MTLFVYAALGATTFLLVVHLQQDLGYSALEAGASLLPITALMLAFSARSAGLAQRIGPRLPMTVGPLLIGAGLLLMGRISPATATPRPCSPPSLVLGCGLVLTVAPLTAAVLAAIDVHRAGVGSAINNAVARIAALLAVAVLPAAAGITALGSDLVQPLRDRHGDHRRAGVRGRGGRLSSPSGGVVPVEADHPLDGAGALRPALRARRAPVPADGGGAQNSVRSSARRPRSSS